MSTAHQWEFRPRFRKHAFGWSSQRPVKRIKEAVSEIKKAARQDKVLAGEGAVVFLEKLPRAVEHVDGSSGALGNAVNKAIDELAPLIAAAPADQKQREKWLQRLWKAIDHDFRPDIEYLESYWGQLCATPERASVAADALLDEVRRNWTDPSALGRHFKSITPCLSSLFAAQRYDELLELVALAPFPFWPYRFWSARTLEVLGQPERAVAHAEVCREKWSVSFGLDQECERILLDNGMPDKAYAGYALQANWKSTYQATFNAIVKKFPHKTKSEILQDCVAQTPGLEGKWFAAAKSGGLLEEAVQLSRTSPCDPKTLTRAARDMAAASPGYATQLGLAALHWLVEGYGYEITNHDVLAAYDHTLEAAANAGTTDQALDMIREMVRAEATSDQFVSKVLGGARGVR